VHIIRILDHYRFRVVGKRVSDDKPRIGLKTDDSWQQRYFKGATRSEFDFLFGILRAGG
jgi:hypothetical protein